MSQGDKYFHDFEKQLIDRNGRPLYAGAMVWDSKQRAFYIRNWETNKLGTAGNVFVIACHGTVVEMRSFVDFGLKCIERTHDGKT